MNFFGIGLPEMAVIAAIGLLVFGPKRLPELGRTLGRTLKGFQSASSEFEKEFRTAIATVETATVETAKVEASTGETSLPEPASTLPSSAAPSGPEVPSATGPASLDAGQVGQPDAPMQPAAPPPEVPAS
jgi:sec-independent protein translocase protein TatA